MNPIKTQYNIFYILIIWTQRYKEERIVPSFSKEISQKHPLTSYEVPETKMYKGIEREEVFGKHLRTPPFSIKKFYLMSLISLMSQTPYL